MLTHQFDTPRHPARVVILGSGGFVAAATQTRLLSEGVAVLPLPRTALDLTAAGAADRLSAELRSDDALLFVSAKAPVKNEAMLMENIAMGAAVCDALRRVPVAHVVYISSDAVYADSDSPLTERSCAQPGSLHGIMHLAREVMLANAFTGPLCLLRPTLVYGFADPHNGYGPNRFMRLAAAGKNIELFGDGEERRDHVCIDDVAGVTSGVLLRRSTGTLNVATGDVTSFRDIAQVAIELFPGRSRIETRPRVGPMPHNGLRPFDVTALRAAFPDVRSTPLRQGLAAVRDSLVSREA
jgi:UDP-glucose 4-epimerase